MFNLLELHNKEKDEDMKGSWIKAKGRNLNKLVSKIIDDFTIVGFTKQNIISELSKRWSCHDSTTKRHLYSSLEENNWVALSFLIELMNIWKEWLEKSSLEVEKN